MGTRIVRLTLALGLVCMALSSLAWADTAASASAPVAVAQGDDQAAPATPAVKPELLGVTQNARGTVYYYDDRHWEAWVTTGAINGLRPKAQVEFLRKGEVIATGEVKTVKDADCIITPAKGTPAGAILKGDQVRIVENGTRADLEKVMAKEKHLQDIGTIFFTALIATTIAVAR